MSEKEESKTIYHLNLTFNNQLINKITITDHYQEKHADINDELILKLIEKLDGIEMDPRKNYNGRDIYL